MYGELIQTNVTQAATGERGGSSAHRNALVSHVGRKGAD